MARKIKLPYDGELDISDDFYKTHHGLHVIDNVFIDGCEPCRQRAIILTLSRMKGEDPDKAVQDSKQVAKYNEIFAREKG